jgi:hypothetical protein
MKAIFDLLDRVELTEQEKANIMVELGEIGDMLSMVEKMKETRDVILQDERMRYKLVNVNINAPLALFQMGMSTSLHLIEDLLQIKRTKLPIKNEKIQRKQCFNQDGQGRDHNQSGSSTN